MIKAKLNIEVLKLHPNPPGANDFISTHLIEEIIFKR